MKIVIIGSGMAGLTAGAYLAKAGHDVTVFEQFDSPGGVTATVRQDGFGWDIGPLLLEGFAPGDKGRIILEELGVSDQVPVVQEDRGLSMGEFAIWKPKEYEGPYWRREQLKVLFPAERDALDHYYLFYDQMIKLMGLARRSETALGLASLWIKIQMWLAFQTVKAKANWNASQLMDYYFKSPVLKTLFLGIVADFVTAPSEFPALGVPSIHLETAFDKRIPTYPGTHSAQTAYTYILNGCQKLVDATMGVILDKGGKVLTNHTVKRIMVENGRATGVELAGGYIEPADLVLTSGGMKEVFFDLVGREYLSADFIQQIEANRMMESVLMVQLGIDFDPRAYQPAALCYYYHTQDLEGAVKRLRSGDYHEGKEGFLIYIPSLHSPSLAPGSKYAVTVYTVAPDSLDRGSWSERREELADKLVIEAERYIPGLRQHTLTRLILTPEDYRTRTHQKHHSFGGVPPVIGNKPPAHKSPIAGLWFIGAQSESGGGVLNVMLGAQKVAKRILKGQ
ncbi:MAG TPA: NAD(P)/FAD-dependent oxidoreductase [Anaerolineales bacterium]|nr:NAD(P)/FAD-dependent oxidoreductase [Anaerolineales bacterium]